MIEKLIFYFPQISIGILVSIATAIIGFFVLLRKSVFLGITLSQSITVGVILSFLLDIHSEWLVQFLGVMFFLPVFYFYRKHPFKEAVLATGFVFYTALGQILTALGASVQNHIVTAYFGNILLIPSGEWLHIIIPLTLFSILFILFYKRILAISLDETYTRVIRFPYYTTEIVYFFLLSGVLSLSIYFMGSFYSMAHLIIPAFLSLQLVRSLKTAFLIAIILSATSTVTGFMISLYELPLFSRTIHLPTSSMIVLVLTSFLILLIKKK